MTHRQLPSHPRVPRTRATAIERDVLVVQQASVHIAELGSDLDRKLSAETRESERLRCLREATNRITRTANDAIQAYRRARRSLDAEAAKERDSGATQEVLKRLGDARIELLAALDAASSRYPVRIDRPEETGQSSEGSDSP